MSMRKILKEWRKFKLTEGQHSPDVAYGDDLEPNLSLHHVEEDEDHYIILYRKQKYVDAFYIVGYASVDLLTDTGDKRFNCIPKTYQVGAIYVEPELQGKGFGQLLYDLAFAAIGDDAGLTSDKYSGTQAAAKRKWKKMENSPEYEKRKTQMKNDEFDYDGKKTPDDPEDDCGTAMDLGDTNATDHSLKKKGNSDGVSKLNAFKAQHQQNDFLNRDDVENKLLNKAVWRFGEIYSQMTNYN